VSAKKDIIKVLTRWELRLTTTSSRVASAGAALQSVDQSLLSWYWMDVQSNSTPSTHPDSLVATGSVDSFSLGSMDVDEEGMCEQCSLVLIL
jgi:hypothetical protein